MKPFFFIASLVFVVMLATGCYAIKHGETVNYTRLSTDRWVVVNQMKKVVNRYYYKVTTYPSKTTLNFYEFDTIYRAGDTLRIDRQLAYYLGI